MHNDTISVVRNAESIFMMSARVFVAFFLIFFVGCTALADVPHPKERVAYENIRFVTDGVCITGLGDRDVYRHTATRSMLPMISDEGHSIFVPVDVSDL